MNTSEQYEYDPEKEEKEMFFNQMVSSIKHIERVEERELRHGEEGGRIYKYDLPVVNEPIEFRNKALMLVD